MSEIRSIDRSALAHGQSVDMANHMLNQSGLRVGFDRRRGRGAGLNPAGRYEPFSRAAFDDGWNTIDELPAFKTEVQNEAARTIITRNTSPDISFEQSVNPYRGCEHGCVYCFARPSHAYMGLSPGLDFESKLFAKPNAAELLEAELSKPGYEPKSIAIGTNTDPYQPIEKTRRIMRDLLEVLERANHPVGIVTKSALVTRDIDILQRMAAKGLARVAISVTTMDRKLARTMEPRAATPAKRFETVRQLTEAGIPTMVMTAPIIPGLTDSEIERLLEAAREAGAREAGYVLLRLPLEVSPLFKEWLLRHYPNRFRHVMTLLRAMRDGRDYDPEWGQRMTGKGPYALQIRRRFELAAKRLELNLERSRLRTDLFRSPKGGGVQLSLL
ncbi:PA0069 family radical SAM protein [Aureimonas sp. ME7]|uniref:PA0069 family radical SAM protein n=1 Tax=Aureimonas sp. ME7 TaxID=2744252 RepID=UPI0015F76353|nr:PA0069 family radical SAM protein [Aureimonas sp. ME7]